MSVRRNAILAAVVVGIALAAAVWWSLEEGSGATLLEPDNVAVVTQGRAVYAQHCAACHGANLEGQPEWRTRLPSGRLPAPPHDASGHTWHHSDEVLFGITRDGVAKYAPGHQSDMPVYAGILSDADIRAALSFIKSTWPDNIRAMHDRVNQQVSPAR